MKEVRIKVKTLIVIILAIMVLGSSIYFLTDNIIYGIGVFYDKFGNKDVASAYYSKVTDKFFNRDAAIKAANKQIENILEDNNFDYLRDNVVMSEGGMTKSGGNIDSNSLLNINHDYKRIVKSNNESELLGKYSIGVSIMNWFGGEYKRAIDILESINYLEGDMEEIRKLNLSSMYMNIGEIHKGRELLDNDKKDDFRYLRKDLLNYSYFMTEEYENFSWHESDYSVRYQVHKSIDEAYIKPLLGLNDLISSFNEMLKHEESITDNKNKVFGKVTLNGSPLSYTVVFVKSSEYRGLSSSLLGLGMGLKGIAISDKEGNYVIDNIPNGKYTIGLSIDWQRIKDKQVKKNNDYNIVLEGNTKVNENIEFFDSLKVTKVEKLDKDKISFTWEDNRKDVKYYTLSIGFNREGYPAIGYYSDEIYDNNYILDINEARSSGSSGRGLSYGMDGVDPYSILDPISYKGEYAYIINGYDEEGNKITSNRGIFPNKKTDTIALDGRELSAGDKLLIERKYEEAIKEYEKSLENNSSDMETVKVLALLYTYGWEYDDSSNGEKLLGKDYDKAMNYYEVLEEKDKLSNNLLEPYARVLVSLEEYDKAIKLYGRLIERGEDYHYSSLGKMYVYKKDFSKAIEYYKKFIEKTNYDHAVDNLIMIYVLENKTDLLLDVSRNYKDTNYHDSYEDVIKDYINIDKSGYDKFYDLIKNSDFIDAEKILNSKNDDLSKLYKGILILQKPLDRFEREEEYKKLYDDISDSTIKVLMEYLGKDNIHSNFGNPLFED